MALQTSYIGLGSNLEHPLQQLQAAARALATIPESQLIRVSPIYRSAAVGPGEQPDYLNAVARLETTLPPMQLLDALQAVEHQQGRVRTVRWGARSLDLDLLLYGNETVNHPRLTVPHYALRQRNFVLYPLADVADDNLRLPDGTELVTLLANCPRGGLLDQPFELEL